MKLYGVDLNSDDDEDYQPAEEEIKKAELEEKGLNYDINEVFNEMKQFDAYKIKECNKSSKQIAEEVMEQLKKSSVKRVKFAGKSFLINDNGEINEEIIEAPQPIAKINNNQLLTLKEMKDSFRYYKEVLKKISNKTKIISSVTKSKLDWKQYKTKERIDQQMEQKRKSGKGILDKAKFLEQANENYFKQQQFMKQPSSASHKFQMIKSKKIEPSPIQKQFQHYLGNQSSRQYSTQKSKEKVEIPNDSKMILKTQNNGSIGERRKPDPNNGSLTDRTSLKNRTLSTQSRIQASPIRVRPLTTKELIQHKDPPRKQQVQPQQTRTLTPQSPQKIAVVTPKPQQQSLTNKFKPAYQRGTALPFKVTTNTPSTSNLDSSTISTRSMQQKPSRDEKSKSMYKKPLSQSQLTSPRAKTPQSNNKNFEPLYSIVRPIFKEANYYQTSLFHFHHELMKNQQSPFHFYYTLEYSTEELRKYFKDIYQEHFAQNFNCLQYCKRFQEKKQNLKIVKLENSSVPQQCKSKIIRTVIFDLDETLIHCNDNNNDPTDHTILVKLPYENAVETRINIRPYCQQMLKLLSQHYELMLFTASYSYYADKVLEIIDPDKTIFKYRFYRESCLELEDGLFIKDLRVLGNRNLDNVILVDNAAYSYCYQLDNGVPIIPFYDNKYDKELIFLTDYLLSLEKQPQWLYQNKIQFRNYLYQQCSSSEECMTELFKVHNQY